ncbi:PAS domain-containing protein [Phenylobacterium sp. RIFCSPHIGHO2_01_FULL_69_31]|uniref:sensor histidine kinase n=1 Tax=Phenylobacterium sp. RIFCSPHIGHO2_01_FULL_69_31 TaxID=1801944 RepID=UPI000A76FC65|nr:PAS domain-containing protein [Phenylobacterium sp. RIFCSPHIGHO2_01_FULL_69_31]
MTDETMPPADDRQPPAVRSAGEDVPWAPAGGPDAPGVSQTQATFQVLTEAMPQMVWSTRPDGFHDYYNARWYEFTGAPPGSTDGEGWSGMFHPDDQEKAWARWRHSLETGEPYEVEYRLRHHSGEYRWTLGRALPVRDDVGRITRWIGTCTDIDQAKRAAEQNELLSRELSHRIKNIFAVISGLIGLTSRHEPTLKPWARDLQHRIAALGRAHEFARPHSEMSRPELGTSTLRGLLTEIFRPYPAFDEGRIVVAGDDVFVDDRGATPVALAFHELATNAAKYGALSTPDGRVEVGIEALGPTMRIGWVEQGGPPVAGPPAREGFGSRLAELSIVQQLGGAMRRDWRREGLAVEMDLPAAHLSREGGF